VFQVGHQRLQQLKFLLLNETLTERIENLNLKRDLLFLAIFLNKDENILVKTVEFLPGINKLNQTFLGDIDVVLDYQIEDINQSLSYSFLRA
jgi:hypothetical protein